MRKRLINVASVNPDTPRAMLEAISRGGVRAVIFSAMQGREVGYCHRYWLDGEDLWSEAWLVDDAAEDSPGVHAEAVIAKKGDKAILCAVALTSMPRGMLNQARLGKPFFDALRAALDAGGFTRKGAG